MSKKSRARTVEKTLRALESPGTKLEKIADKLRIIWKKLLTFSLHQLYQKHELIFLLLLSIFFPVVYNFVTFQ